MGSGDHRTACPRRRGIIRWLRRREDAFALALLIQLAVFVVGPGAHLINHSADHTHGPDGVTHTHDSSPSPAGAPAPTAPPFHDGHGSALHFGVALTSVPVFVGAFAIAVLLASRLWQSAPLPYVRTPFDIAHPRGPPVAV